MPKLFCPFLHIPGNEGILLRFSDWRWQMPNGHQHDRLELNLVLKGRGELLFRDRKYPMLPGHMIWIFPHQWHAPFNWSQDLEMWIIEITPRLLDRIARGERQALRAMDEKQNYCRQVSSEQLDTLDRTLAAVETTLLDYETFNQGLLFALYALWDAFLVAQEAPQTLNLHPSIRKTIDLLNLPDHAEDSVADMARKLRMTPAYLSSLFHREVGQTIPEYRNHIRLQQFLNKFEKEPSANLLYLALEAGFGSYAQFHRVFRQFMHKSPKAWLSEK